jgi:hypothetical protein
MDNQPYINAKKSSTIMPMIDELKKEVIYSTDPSRLYEIMLELHESISLCYLNSVKTEDAVQKTELKGKISLYNAMLTIIDKRIDDVKSSEGEKTHRELIMNRQFRMASELVLTKETFEKIKDLSLVNYIKFKGMKEELKKNKLNA